MGLELEKISPCPEGFNVVHGRAKGRTDQLSSKFKIPKKKLPKKKEEGEEEEETEEGRRQRVEDSFDWAACFAVYFGRVKEELGKFQGRVFYTGHKNGGLVGQPMGRNKVAEVSHEVARFLGKENPEAFTFHSFRRSSATAAADAGATVQQMIDFFGWKNPTMTSEYISTSTHQLNAMAQKLGGGGSGSEESYKVGRKKAKRKREDSDSSSSESEESYKVGRKKAKRKREDSDSSGSGSESKEQEQKKFVKKRRGEKKVVIINM